MNAKLVVAAITAQGALSPQFERLVARIAPGDACFEARRALVAATVAGSGAALRNAESQLGICDPKSAAGEEEEDDDGLVDGHEEAAAEQPAPAWLADFVAGPPAEWSATVTEAIVATRGEAAFEVEATEGERPAATSRTVELNTVPAAAATAAEGARTTKSDTTATQHHRAPPTTTPRARVTATTRTALPVLSAQLEDLARRQEGGTARSPSAPAPAPATASTATAASIAAARAAVGEMATAARQRGRRTAEATRVNAGSERSTTRNNQSLVVSTSSRSTRAQTADRWKAKVPEPQWWEAINLYH
jgi:hypothetical protein